MLAPHFYHKTIRRATAVFGSLFNNISVVNTNEDTGAIIKTSKVPISYGPKERFLSTEIAPGIAIQLPRLSFEITSLSYHPDVSTSMMRRVTHRMDNEEDIMGRNAKRTYTGTPYKVGMQLNIIGNRQDEVLQIIEQILPYFRPDFMVTINQIDEMESVWDMPITLTSVSPSIDYEGEIQGKRVIIYVLDFEIIVKLYGPLSSQGVIHKVIANIYDIDGDTQYEKIVVEAVPSSPSENGYIINTTITDEFFPEA